MPWKFHARVVPVNCRRCENKISAFSTHLTVPGRTNYHLDCIPTEALLEASFKITSLSVDADVGEEMRAVVKGLLQRGGVLRQQKLERVREQKQTLREMSLKKLHLSYQKQRKPRIIIGCTGIMGFPGNWVNKADIVRARKHIRASQGDDKTRL